MKSITDLTELNKIAEGDKEFIRETLSILIDETPINIQHLTDFVTKKDIPEIKKLVHKLKSSYALFGVEELRNLTADIEKSVNTEEIISLMPRYLEVCDLVSRELKQHIA